MRTGNGTRLTARGSTIEPGEQVGASRHVVEVLDQAFQVLVRPSQFGAAPPVGGTAPWILRIGLVGSVVAGGLAWSVQRRRDHDAGRARRQVGAVRSLAETGGLISA